MAESPKNRRIHWLKLGLTGAAFLVVSIGLGYLFQSILASYEIPVDIPVWLGLLIVFGLLGAVNLTLLPLPIGVSIMLVAASYWHPFLVALAASLGATLGEFSGYFFGFVGKKISIKDDMPVYKLVKAWIDKYGMWAIAFISFQPVIPFDIGGFIAGLTRMPIRKFVPAVWIGKFPKYLILIYLGDILIRLFPSLSF
jgi:uncharacterized membrane protein YdjX (TVP38/TMEM64 family)